MQGVLRPEEVRDSVASCLDLDASLFDEILDLGLVEEALPPPPLTEFLYFLSAQSRRSTCLTFCETTAKGLLLVPDRVVLKDFCFLVILLVARAEVVDCNP